MEMTDFDAASESSIEEWLQNDCDHVFKEEIATLRSNECVKCGMKNPDSEPDF